MSNKVSFEKTRIPAVLIVHTKQFGDERGFFMETWSQRDWAALGFDETFVQDNLSKSAKGTLRGLHYQIEPHPMGKLVRAVTGALFDVAVDIRKGSPTFGQWVGHTLRGDDGTAFWVPPGFAHGFLALEDDTRVYYKSSGLYAPEAERTIRYDDPAIDIEWPGEATNLSEKDVAAPLLADADYNFTYIA